MPTRRAELEARRTNLLKERDRLLACKATMDPDVAARALRVLADQVEELAAEFEALLADRKERMQRGHPRISFRLEPEAYEKLRQLADPVHGTSGGVSLYLRRLVYEHLGEVMPAQYGDKGKATEADKRRKKAVVAKRAKRSAQKRR